VECPRDIFKRLFVRDALSSAAALAALCCLRGIVVAWSRANDGLMDRDATCFALSFLRTAARWPHLGRMRVELAGILERMQRTASSGL